MRRIAVPLILAMVLLFAALPALAEGDNVALELNTAKIPIYGEKDPYIAEMRFSTVEWNDGLPVLAVPVKKGYQLKATVLPKSTPNRKVAFSSADETVLRVQNNTITGVQPGETMLTISSVQNPAVALRYHVLVYQPVSRMAVTAPEKSVPVGGIITLKAEITPANATSQRVNWSSSDERIARVDSLGNVTGTGKGTARIIATAADGSGIRANISLRVTQTAESIQLDHSEATVAAGKSVVLKATVMPANTDDKTLVWSSSDPGIATVNKQGRVTGVALGQCEITCTSQSSGKVQAKATVQVQQPVKKITFGNAPAVYVNEPVKLSWTVEPASASNPAVQLTSGNPVILTVAHDGTITGLKAGETYISAASTDGTNCRARVKVKVTEHVRGVRMLRHTAYIGVKETATTGAEIEPKTAGNRNMTWTSGDPSVATAEPVKKQPYRIRITGVREGDTMITGVTEDGGYTASIQVRVGDWDHMVRLMDAYVRGADVYLTVRNISDMNLSHIVAEVSVFDADGNPVPCNSKNDSNTFSVTHKKNLKPGTSTKESDWQYVDFKLPDSPTVAEYVVKITQYQIENDWVKNVRKKYQQTIKCPVHL